MTVHPRNLLLFLLLSGAALATWVFSRDTAAPVESGAALRPAPQGYYLLGAVLESTDESGRILNRVRAERLEQQPESEDFVLEGISIEYTAESNIHWDLTASDGYMSRDRSVMTLDDALLVRQAVTDMEPATLEASRLEFDSTEHSVQSDRPVTLREGDSEFTAPGIDLNLETNQWSLHPGAKIRHAP